MLAESRLFVQAGAFPWERAHAPKAMRKHAGDDWLLWWSFVLLLLWLLFLLLSLISMLMLTLSLSSWLAPSLSELLQQSLTLWLLC